MSGRAEAEEKENGGNDGKPNSGENAALPKGVDVGGDVSNNNNCGGGDADVKVDIVSGLIKMGMLDALEMVIGHLDFQTILRMHKVCTGWLHFLTTEVNPYKVLLKQRMATNPTFKQACHLNDWTKHIMSHDPTQYQRMKYMAFIGTYISEKQRLLREKKREPDFLLKVAEGDKFFSVKEMRGRLFVATTKITVWNLSQPTAKQPEKVFEVDLEETGYEEDDEDTIKIAFGSFTTNSEHQPWEDLKFVAGSISLSTISRLDGERSWKDEMSNEYLWWYVWNYETGQVVAKGLTWGDYISKVKMYSKHLFVYNEMTLKEEGGRCGWGFDVHSIDKNFDFIQQIGPADSHYRFEEDKIVLITKGGGRFTYRFNGEKYVEEAHLPSAMDSGETMLSTECLQMKGNLGKMGESRMTEIFHAEADGTGGSIIKKEALYDFSDLAKPQFVMEIPFKVNNEGFHMICRLRFIYGGFELCAGEVVRYSTEEVLADPEPFVAQWSSVCDNKDRHINSIQSVKFSGTYILIKGEREFEKHVFVTDLRNVK